MKLDDLTLSVIHYTFSVFDTGLVDLDDLAERIDNSRYDQGFTWWPSHVDLYTVKPDDFGHNESYSECGIDLDVLFDQPVELHIDAVRAIQMPFLVSSNQGVLITDCCESSNVPRKKIFIPPGDYNLIFEQGWKYNPQPIEISPATGENLPEICYTLWGRLWFNPEKNAEPKILLQDPRDEFFNPAYPLRMDGVPFD